MNGSIETEAEQMTPAGGPVVPDGYRKPTIEDLMAYRPQIYTCFYQRVPDHERAEDLTQETFIRAWRSLDSFQPGPGSSLFRWLYRIAIRIGIDAWRHEQLHPQVSLEETFPPGVAPSGEEDALGAPSDLLLLICRTLETMPRQYQQILAWMAGEYKSAEMARMLGVEVAVVYNAQRAARTMFKRRWAKVSQREKEKKRAA